MVFDPIEFPVLNVSFPIETHRLVKLQCNYTQSYSRFLFLCHKINNDTRNRYIIWRDNDTGGAKMMAVNNKNNKRQNIAVNRSDE